MGLYPAASSEGAARGGPRGPHQCSDPTGSCCPMVAGPGVRGPCRAGLWVSDEPHLPVSPSPQPTSSLPSSSTTPESCWPQATRVAGSSSSSGNQRCGRVRGGGLYPPRWSLRRKSPAFTQHPGLGGRKVLGWDPAGLGWGSAGSAQQMLVGCSLCPGPQRSGQDSQSQPLPRGRPPVDLPWARVSWRHPGHSWGWGSPQAGAGGSARPRDPAL